MAATIGTGTTIAFSSGFLAEILSVGGPNPSRESIETSHMGTTTAKTFTPALLVDNGELSVSIHFDPAEAPPIGSDAESIVITFPDTEDSTWTFSGFMTSFDPTTPLEDKMTADVTIKVSGAITVG